MSVEGQNAVANFNRPPRQHILELPHEEIEIPPPPFAQPPQENNWLIAVIPVLGIGVMSLFYVLRALSGDQNSAWFAIPLFFLAVLTIGGTLFAQNWRRREQQRQQDRNMLNYLRMLEKKRARLQAAHDAQSALLEQNFPSVRDSFNLILAHDPRLWERRPEHRDFINFRLGVGRVPLDVSIRTPDPDLENPELQRALKLADEYRFIENAPVIASFQTHPSLGVCGHREHTLKLARSLIAHLALTHAPSDLHIYLIAPRTHYEDWRWLEWLPHTAEGELAFDTEAAHNLLGVLAEVMDGRASNKTPHLLVIIDMPQLAEGTAIYPIMLQRGNHYGISAICLTDSYENVPGECSALVTIDPRGGGFRYTQNNREFTGRVVDQLTLQDAEYIARALSSVSLRESGSGGRIPRRVNFFDLYSVKQSDELDSYLQKNWHRNVLDGVLPFPVAIGRENLITNMTLLLDENHHGPHGVLAGTTGSGKSELLQTLICSLVIEHDPLLVNLLLIDFKGGSTFNLFGGLPHTVGMITNLDGVLVERALEALRAEVKYRQQFLKKMNVRDITQYHRFYGRTPLQRQDAEYRPLPHLFIIVDEFAQLAKEMPEFLRELVRIAQVGRSLGLHLILGTQSPMDVITDEMNANLQFRICLRVQNIEASRAMLRRPDAAYLPTGWAGRGYFQVGERGVFKQFQTAYVSGEYVPQTHDSDDLVLELITDHGEHINLLSENSSDKTGEMFSTARAIVETVTQYAQNHNIQQMPPLLLPPLEERITLADVFQKAEIIGWNGREWRQPGRDQNGKPVRLGSALVGLVDDIYNRTQNPLWIHLNNIEQEHTERGGHVLVIGSPGTGKTTFLKTLAICEALLHPPDKLHMYFVSFVGSGLNDLGNLPHAEQVIYGTETERVRRLFGRLIHTLNERQNGQAQNLPLMVVFIDQYEQFREMYLEQHMTDFERLINEGRANGIHLVLTASSITAVPERLRALIQQRVVFQLGTAADYTLAVGHLNTNATHTLPKGGAFIYHNPPLTCQIALPLLKPTVNDSEINSSLRELTNNLCSSYLALKNLKPDKILPEQAQNPAPLKALPGKVVLDTLPLPPASPHVITPLGLSDDDTLSLFNLNWWENGPHFIVTGPSRSGKTNLLHAAILSAAKQYPPKELRFLLVDFTGRSLKGLQKLKHVIAYITEVDELEKQLTHLTSEMAAAQTFEDDFPKTVLVFDDYDMVSETLSAHLALLRQLRDHSRQHAGLGLHLWLAGYLERIGDPFIKQLLLRRSGFALTTKEALLNLNIRANNVSSEAMPTGRAYFAQHGTVRIVQTAYVENVPLMVNLLNKQIWSDEAQAAWYFPATIEPEESPREAPDTLSKIDTNGLLQDLLGEDS